MGVFLKTQFLYSGQSINGEHQIVFLHFAPHIYQNCGLLVVLLVVFWVYFGSFGFINKWICLCSVLVFRSLEGIKKSCISSF